jgi:hypothetical protein
MSRSGYSDDYEQWSLIRWRGAVASAIRGNRGQAFLREMIEALDAMPEKRLIEEELELNGEVCAMGAVAVKRGLDVSNIDPTEREEVAKAFGIAEAMAAEIAYENDECAWGVETPEHRWARMRAWAVSNLTKASRNDGAS